MNVDFEPLKGLREFLEIKNMKIKVTPNFKVYTLPAHEPKWAQHITQYSKIATRKAEITSEFNHLRFSWLFYKTC